MCFPPVSDVPVPVLQLQIRSQVRACCYLSLPLLQFLQVELWESGKGGRAGVGFQHSVSHSVPESKVGITKYPYGSAAAADRI